jgi:hypothetical protein
MSDISCDGGEDFAQKRCVSAIGGRLRQYADPWKEHVHEHLGSHGVTPWTLQSVAAASKPEAAEVAGA